VRLRRSGASGNKRKPRHRRRDGAKAISYARAF
jgi:hypothetical protein